MQTPAGVAVAQVVSVSDEYIVVSCALTTSAARWQGWGTCYSAMRLLPCVLLLPTVMLYRRVWSHCI
jgi:hypothetical protein